jgi:hypothetical protein
LNALVIFAFLAGVKMSEILVRVVLGGNTEMVAGEKRGAKRDQGEKR